jgi:hypothetical protein
MTNIQGNQAPAKRQKKLKKFENSSRRPSPNNPCALRHRWDQLWSLQEILTENSNMSRIAAKFVTRFLTNDQKQWRVNACLELREKANGDPTFMCIFRIITGDESWIYGSDPERKQQSSQWKSPQSQRAKKGAAGPEFIKEHAHCFFDVKGIVHRKFVPPNTTVNSYF